MKKFFSFLFVPIALLACANTVKNDSINNALKEDVELAFEAQKGEQVAYFASGCFWCVEEVFEAMIGVREAVSGYAGGSETNPTYKQVSAGKTSHAESVMVFYNPEEVSFENLVAAFFASHDPTTLNRQGPDAGTQYRSIAFYSTENEKAIIEKAISELAASKKYTTPIVTEVKKIDKFWNAEDYHQNYVEHNPGNPYVQSVSIPRFERFKRNFDLRLLR
jgi:peptide-methionine (S)-S-oxide reductase